jgi:uncharacterized membrane protein
MKTQTAKSKKYLYVFLLLLMFVLNWAALHDITKNNEPDLTAEYLVVGVSVSVLIGLALYLIIKKLNRFERS